MSGWQSGNCGRCGSGPVIKEGLCDGCRARDEIQGLDIVNARLRKVVDAAKSFFIEREKGEVCDCLTEHYSKLHDALAEFEHQDAAK